MCSGSVLTGRTGAVLAVAVRARIIAVLALAGLVIARRAGAIVAGAVGTGIVAVPTLAGGALVIMTVMLVVDVTVMEVIDVVMVDHSFVAATRAVGVLVGLGRTMLSGDSHGCAPSCG